jgi:hypothetical protein
MLRVSREGEVGATDRTGKLPRDRLVMDERQNLKLVAVDLLPDL